ncbi:MAG: aconitate hydratase AcnA [Spirochaetales bacterium]|nr:aconitate hydratase AcnA [Spirochaetales bacterium]
MSETQFAESIMDSFGTRKTLEYAGRQIEYYSLKALAGAGFPALDRMPYSIRILVENMLRNEDGNIITRQTIENILEWTADSNKDILLPYMPARVLLQDFTGVPAVVDLAAMRDAAQRLHGNALMVNPKIPVELVIDHSIQIDSFGSEESRAINEKKEFERNDERYRFLRWGQKSLDNFRVVPPGTGICHQVNLEYLARVVFEDAENGIAYPDTLIGTDSHTTMINGIGVMGWGVGGIEAEAVMMGQPYYMLAPQVVGVRFLGELAEGVTATDLVLLVTQRLRAHGVVGKFVEYYGPGLDSLTLEDRATVANMSPEYGATMGFFPVDAKTIDYLKLSGRSETRIALIEAYCRAQGLFRESGSADPLFSSSLDINLADVRPGLAGPKRPQDRIELRDLGADIRKKLDGAQIDTENLSDGSVVIASITSCTNTSNPAVLIAAGLLARNAVARGLKVKPWVKTSFAPGSKVVMSYLEKAGLVRELEALQFHNVGYGCATCIGNSGPLPGETAARIESRGLTVAAVLSGNRNFEGRVHPLTKLNYLASPPLVVAYALAGSLAVDFEKDPLGSDKNGNAVFLRDIWPADSEISAVADGCVLPGLFAAEYSSVFTGPGLWRNLPAGKSAQFAWTDDSSYIRNPPFFSTMTSVPGPVGDINAARVLAVLGDSVTTDHISPAGVIPKDSPAGTYLQSLGIDVKNFNSFGSRRGNHEVMMRGTFGNIRLQNKMVPGKQGGWTKLLPEGKESFIYDAAMEYAHRNVPLVVLAGKEYGTGSSRDWAAKGTMLLGVKAVIAESFERIHRNNLVCMGVLPLEYINGENTEHLGLNGTETITISGIGPDLNPGSLLDVTAERSDGTRDVFKVRARIDSVMELAYYRNQGILPYVLRNMKE